MSETTVEVYYTDFSEDNPYHELAQDIRMEMVDVDEIGLKEFSKVYDYVGEEVVDEDEWKSVLDMMWERWNRGSGRESQNFLEHEIRSLSVGDILKFNSRVFIVRRLGWEPVPAFDGMGL